MKVDWKEFDSDFKHVHDWRTYIPKDLRDWVDKLCQIDQQNIIRICQEIADKEEWE